MGVTNVVFGAAGGGARAGGARATVYGAAEQGDRQVRLMQARGWGYHIVGHKGGYVLVFLAGL
jgi:hypothetical protein